MKKVNATRFPVARIKKLIQADEDVGKVASATPIVVSKALELFLGSLVAECVKDAEARGSNKITAYGLKRTITSTEIFDFCSDIVAGVADPITDEVGTEETDGKKKRTRKKPTVPKMTESDDEGSPATKKRKPAARAVKKEGEEGAVGEDEEDGEDGEEKAELVAKKEESDYEEEGGAQDDE